MTSPTESVSISGLTEGIADMNVDTERSFEDTKEEFDMLCDGMDRSKWHLIHAECFFDMNGDASEYYDAIRRRLNDKDAKVQPIVEYLFTKLEVRIVKVDYDVRFSQLKKEWITTGDSAVPLEFDDERMFLPLFDEGEVVPDDQVEREDGDGRSGYISCDCLAVKPI